MGSAASTPTRGDDEGDQWETLDATDDAADARERANDNDRGGRHHRARRAEDATTTTTTTTTSATRREREGGRSTTRATTRASTASVSGTYGELRRSLKAMCETRDATPEITDVFWYEIGNAVSEPMTSVSERTLDEILRPYGRALFVNNARNGGLYKLAKHAARQLSVASGNARSTPVSAINVTLLVSIFIKYFIEFASEGDGGFGGVAALGGGRSERVRALAATFARDERWETGGGPNASLENTSPFDDLLRACVDVLCGKHVTAQTMALHVACARLLLVATSSQLTFNLDDAEAREIGHPLARRIAAIGSSDSRRTGVLMCALLRRVIERPPNIDDIYEGAVNRENAEANGITRGMASVLSSMLSMRSKPNKDVTDNTGSHVVIKCAHTSRSPLADECANLFLALCTHGAFGNRDENPFRIAVKNMKDISSRSSVASNKRPSELVDFERLAVALSASLCTDVGLLLSYVTLSTNSRFVSHLSSSAATSRFVQGLLKELYEAESNKLAHVSQLIVTIFLILSQDVRFNRMMQTETIASSNWYKERILQNSSLASLIVVVLSRTIKYNVAKTATVSKMLNALGSIANMACVTRDISGYAAQRLVNTLALFTRRYFKITRENALSSDGLREPFSDADVCEDFIRVIFEILNCLATDLDSLEHNPEIVYALMHREELLTTYRTHEVFAEYVQNIETVLQHYKDAVESAQNRETDSPISVRRLKRVISETSLTPSPQKRNQNACDRDCSVHDFHPMRFAYVEDEVNAPYFLIPYVWGVVHAQSGVFWNRSAIALFAADADADASLHSSMSEDGPSSDVV